MSNFKNTVLAARFTIDEAAAAETDGPGEEQAEGLAVTQVVTPGHGKLTQGVEFTYGATAEDNGIAGELDLQPGVVFSGPAGLYTVAKVRVFGVDVLEGSITVPDAEDTCTLALYVNSALWAVADEVSGASAPFAPDESFDTETVFEFNISETDLALTENDVIRVAILGVEANEETLDWDIGDEGTLEIK